MKRQFLFGAMFSTALAVGAAAQTGTGSTTPSQTPRTTQGDQQSVTVTGCLLTADQAGRMSATGTSGSATGSTTGSGTSATGSGTGSTATGSPSSQTGSAGQFVLMTSGAAGTSGTSAAGSATGSTATGSTAGTGTGTTGAGGMSAAAHKGFRLVAGSENLSQYANKQVEIRGTLQAGNRGGAGMGSTGSATGSTTGSATGSTTGSTSGTTAGGTAQGRVDVASLPMLSVTSVRQIADSCSGDKR